MKKFITDFTDIKDSKKGVNMKQIEKFLDDMCYRYVKYSVRCYTKPFLFKSKVEKILSILGVVYDDPEYTETWGKVEVEGFEIPYYEVVCKMKARVNGEIIGFGIGSANTLEKKYCKDKNTILKMAEKKARVDIALHIGALSNIFTQDEESVDVEQKQEKQDKQEQRQEHKPSQKQINYLLNLLEQHKENKELVKKAAMHAKIRMVDDKIVVEGNSKEVSEAIDMLTKS